MNWHRRSVATLWLALAVTLSACGGGSGAVPQATPSPRPAFTENAAWVGLLDQIKADGTVDTETALKAFALAFGPLPGVQVARDGGPIMDGSAALRWLVGHWNDISADQRTAARRLVPELAGLVTPTADRPGDVVATGTVLAAEYAASRATPSARGDLFYTVLAMQLADEIARHLPPGQRLTIPVKASVGGPDAREALMDTGVYNAQGGYTGDAARCSIRVSASGDRLTGDDLYGVMAHEVWHCYEGALGGLDHYWSFSRPSWVVEGEAEWVGASLYPGAAVWGGAWRRYLRHPDVPLFRWAYSAVGFYAQMDQAHLKPWERLIDIFRATGNEAAAIAAGTDNNTLLDQWASGFLRMPERGPAWDIVGPGETDDRYTPVTTSVGAGGTAAVTAPPWENAVHAVTTRADVLAVTSSGHARVSDGAGRDYLINDASRYCVKNGGCECPAGSTYSGPPLTPLAAEFSLAVTGGASGATATAVGSSLESFCSGKPGTSANNTVVEPCTLISPADARLALGGEVHVVAKVLPDPLTGCTYSRNLAPDGILSVSDFAQAHYPGPKGPGTFTEQIRAAAEALAAQNGSSVVDLPGVGDAAFLTLISRNGTHAASLNFVKGSVYVSIVAESRTLPPTAETMTTLGRAAAARL